MMSTMYNISCNMLSKLTSLLITLVCLLFFAGDCGGGTTSPLSNLTNLAFQVDNGTIYDFDFKTSPGTLSIKDGFSKKTVQLPTATPSSAPLKIDQYLVTYSASLIQEGLKNVVVTIKLPENNKIPEFITITSLKKAHPNALVEEKTIQEGQNARVVNNEIALTLRAEDGKNKTLYRILFIEGDLPPSTISTLQRLALTINQIDYDLSFSSSSNTIKIGMADPVTLVSSESRSVLWNKKDYQVLYRHIEDTVEVEIALPEADILPSVFILKSLLKTDKTSVLDKTYTPGNPITLQDGAWKTEVTSEDEKSKTTYRLLVKETPITGTTLTSLEVENPTGTQATVDLQKQSIVFPTYRDVSQSMIIRKLEIDGEGSTVTKTGLSELVRPGTQVLLDDERLNLTITSLSGQEKTYSFTVTSSEVSGAGIASITLDYTGSDASEEPIKLNVLTQEIKLAKGARLKPQVRIDDLVLSSGSEGAVVSLTEGGKALSQGPLSPRVTLLKDTLHLYVASQDGGKVSKYRLVFKEDLYQGNVLTSVSVAYGTGTDETQDVVFDPQTKRGELILPRGSINLPNEVAVYDVQLSEESQSASVKVGDKDLLVGAVNEGIMTDRVSERERKLIVSVTSQTLSVARYEVVFKVFQGHGAVLSKLSIDYKGTDDPEQILLSSQELEAPLQRGEVLKRDMFITGYELDPQSIGATVSLGGVTVENGKRMGFTLPSDGTLSVMVQSEDKQTTSTYKLMFKEDLYQGNILKSVKIVYGSGVGRTSTVSFDPLAKRGVLSLPRGSVLPSTVTISELELSEESQLASVKVGTLSLNHGGKTEGVAVEEVDETEKKITLEVMSQKASVYGSVSEGTEVYEVRMVVGLSQGVTLSRLRLDYKDRDEPEEIELAKDVVLAPMSRGEELKRDMLIHGFDLGSYSQGASVSIGGQLMVKDVKMRVTLPSDDTLRVLVSSEDGGMTKTYKIVFEEDLYQGNILKSVKVVYGDQEGQSKDVYFDPLTRSGQVELLRGTILSSRMKVRDVLLHEGSWHAVVKVDDQIIKLGEETEGVLAEDIGGGDRKITFRVQSQEASVRGENPYEGIETYEVLLLTSRAGGADLISVFIDYQGVNEAEEISLVEDGLNGYTKVRLSRGVVLKRMMRVHRFYASQTSVGSEVSIGDVLLKNGVATETELPSDDTLRLKVVSENGKTSKTYKIVFEEDLYEGNELVSLKIAYAGDGQSKEVNFDATSKQAEIVYGRSTVLPDEVTISDVKLSEGSREASVKVGEVDIEVGSPTSNVSTVTLGEEKRITFTVKSQRSVNRGIDDLNDGVYTVVLRAYKNKGLELTQLSVDYEGDISPEDIHIAGDETQVSLNQGVLLKKPTLMVHGYSVGTSSEGATVSIAGNEIASSGKETSVELNSNDELSVEVVSEDGKTSKEYLIVFKEDLYEGNELVSVKIAYAGDGQSKEVNFNGSSKQAEIVYGRSTVLPDEVTISGVVLADDSKKASVKVGEVDIEVGSPTSNVSTVTLGEEKRITFTVKSQRSVNRGIDDDGDGVYTVVLRAYKNEGVELAQLSVDYEGDISPEDIHIAGDETQVSLNQGVLLKKPTVMVHGYSVGTGSEGATVSIAGNEIASSGKETSVELNSNDELSVEVVSEDGKTSKEYLIVFKEDLYEGNELVSLKIAYAGDGQSKEVIFDATSKQAEIVYARSTVLPDEVTISGVVLADDSKKASVKVGEVDIELETATNNVSTVTMGEEKRITFTVKSQRSVHRGIDDDGDGVYTVVLRAYKNEGVELTNVSVDYEGDISPEDIHIAGDETQVSLNQGVLLKKPTVSVHGYSVGTGSEGATVSIAGNEIASSGKATSVELNSNDEFVVKVVSEDGKITKMYKIEFQENLYPGNTLISMVVSYTGGDDKPVKFDATSKQAEIVYARSTVLPDEVTIRDVVLADDSKKASVKVGEVDIEVGSPTSNVSTVTVGEEKRITFTVKSQQKANRGIDDIGDGVYTVVLRAYKNEGVELTNVSVDYEGDISPEDIHIAGDETQVSLNQGVLLKKPTVSVHGYSVGTGSEGATVSIAGNEIASSGKETSVELNSNDEFVVKVVSEDGKITKMYKIEFQENLYPGNTLISMVVSYTGGDDKPVKFDATSKQAEIVYARSTVLPDEVTIRDVVLADDSKKASVKVGGVDIEVGSPTSNVSTVTVGEEKRITCTVKSQRSVHRGIDDDGDGVYTVVLRAYKNEGVELAQLSVDYQDTPTAEDIHIAGDETQVSLNQGVLLKKPTVSVHGYSVGTGSEGATVSIAGNEIASSGKETSVELNSNDEFVVKVVSEDGKITKMYKIEFQENLYPGNTLISMVVSYTGGDDKPVKFDATSKQAEIVYARSTVLPDEVTIRDVVLADDSKKASVKVGGVDIEVGSPTSNVSTVTVGEEKRIMFTVKSQRSVNRGIDDVGDGVYTVVLRVYKNEGVELTQLSVDYQEDASPEDIHIAGDETQVPLNQGVLLKKPTVSVHGYSVGTGSEGATVLISGNEIASSGKETSVELNSNDEFVVKVVSEDGKTTKMYKIEFQENLYPGNTLISMVVSYTGGDDKPVKFDATSKQAEIVYARSTVLPDEVTIRDVVLADDSKKASVKVGGVDIEVGSPTSNVSTVTVGEEKRIMFTVKSQRSVNRGIDDVGDGVYTVVLRAYKNEGVELAQVSVDYQEDASPEDIHIAGDETQVSLNQGILLKKPTVSVHGYSVGTGSEGATVTISGNEIASSGKETSVELNSNDEFVVKVVSEDGKTTKMYKIAFQENLYPGNTLISMVVSYTGGDDKPVKFDATSKQAEIVYGRSTVLPDEVTISGVVLADDSKKASVKVGEVDIEVGSPTSNVSTVTVGEEKRITFTVKSQRSVNRGIDDDGDGVYTVVLRAYKNEGVELTQLSVDYEGDISPEDIHIAEDETQVPLNQGVLLKKSMVSVHGYSVGTGSEGATVTIAGNEIESSGKETSVELNSNDEFVVKVVSEDGKTTKMYKIAFQENLYPGNTLISMVVSYTGGDDKAVNFDATSKQAEIVYARSTVLPDEVTIRDVVLADDSKKASVKVGGVDIEVGSPTSNVSTVTVGEEKRITFTVKSQRSVNRGIDDLDDGVYTVVLRAYKNEGVELTQLSVDYEGDISPEDIHIAEDETQVSLNQGVILKKGNMTVHGYSVGTSSEGATVLISGNEIASSGKETSVELNSNDELSVEVVSEDGKTTKMYKIAFKEDLYKETILVSMNIAYEGGGAAKEVRFDENTKGGEIVYDRLTLLPDKVIISHVELAANSQKASVKVGSIDIRLSGVQPWVTFDVPTTESGEERTITFTVKSQEAFVYPSEDVSVARYTVVLRAEKNKGVELTNLSLDYEGDEQLESIDIDGEIVDVSLMKGEILKRDALVSGGFSLGVGSEGAVVKVGSVMIVNGTPTMPLPLSSKDTLLVSVESEDESTTKMYKLAFKEDLYKETTLVSMNIAYEGGGAAKEVRFDENTKGGEIVYDRLTLLPDKVIISHVELATNSQKASVKVGSIDIRLSGVQPWVTFDVPTTESGEERTITFTVKSQEAFVYPSEDVSVARYTVVLRAEKNKGVELTNLSLDYEGDEQLESIDIDGEIVDVSLTKGEILKRDALVSGGFSLGVGSEGAVVKVGSVMIVNGTPTMPLTLSSNDTLLVSVESEDESTTKTYKLAFKEDLYQEKVLKELELSLGSEEVTLTIDEATKTAVGMYSFFSTALSDNGTGTAKIKSFLVSEKAVLRKPGSSDDLLVENTISIVGGKAVLLVLSQQDIHRGTDPGQPYELTLTPRMPTLESYTKQTVEVGGVSLPVLGIAVIDDILTSGSVVISVEGLEKNTGHHFSIGADGTKFNVTSDASGTVLIKKENLPSNLSNGSIIYLFSEDNDDKSLQIAKYEKYKLWVWQDLQGVREDASGDYTIEKDLTFPSPGSEGFPSAGFSPINNFSGSLDGNDLSVNSFYINRTGTSNVGLFGTTSSSSHIQDLKLAISDRVSGSSYVGSVVGKHYGVLTNVSVSGGKVSGTSYVGGLVGQVASSDANISNSSVQSSVEGRSGYIGGVVGYGRGTITDCYYSLGQVAGGSSDNVGGFAGYFYSGSMLRCYVTEHGSVAGRDYVGGLVGQLLGGDVTECYSLIHVTGSRGSGGLVGYSSSSSGSIRKSYATGAITSNHHHAGGLIGYSFASVTDCRATGAVTSSGENVGGLIGYSRGSVTNCYARGTVNGEGSNIGGLIGYSIASVTDCYARIGTVNGKGSNIGGLIGYSIASVTNCYASGNVQGNNNSSNVGGLIGDARNSVINSWYTSGTVRNSGGSYTGGLIGSMYSSGTVDNCYFSGYVYGGNYTGGLIGRCHRFVHNSYSRGTTSGKNYTGGLIGELTSTGRLENSYVSNRVYGSGNYIGGLVGLNNGIVINCFSTALIYTTSGVFERIGGLVGTNSKVIKSCFSASTVYTSSSGNNINVGGFAGRNDGTITDCYAMSYMRTYGYYIGGFVGVNIGSQLYRCYQLERVTILAGTAQHTTNWFAGFPARFDYVYTPARLYSYQGIPKVDPSCNEVTRSEFNNLKRSNLNNVTSRRAHPFYGWNFKTVWEWTISSAESDLWPILRLASTTSTPSTNFISLFRSTQVSSQRQAISSVRYNQPYWR